MPMNEEERKPKHHPHPQADMLHVHTYLTEVNVADDHQHIIMGVSGPAREKGNSHVHRIHGRTSFISEESDECGHWHTQDVMTGPAIEMPDCNHVHYFEGITSKDDDHCHTFAGATGLGPSLFCTEDTEDECEDEDDYDDCEEEEDTEDECEMPGKMPKYKYKYGKRPEEK